MKRIAVITMARNDEFFLNRWVKYYGGLFGEENLYIYLDGLDQQPPKEAGKTNVQKVEKQGTKVVSAENLRLNFLSDRAAELFQKGYEIIIGCDSDEFLIVDPQIGKSLPEYLSTLKIKCSLSPLGVDIGQNLKEELPLDKTRPILEQRNFALINSRFTKTNIITKPVRWGRGFHRVRGHNFHIDSNLYLLHCGNTDYETLLVKFHSKDIIERGEQAHFKRARLSVIQSITDKKSISGDKIFGWARIIQTIFRPIYAWNKPSMLGLRWVIKLPKRFENTGI